MSEKQYKTLTLTSEKYFANQLRHNLRQQRNASATQLFANMLIITIAAFVCYVAIKTMPAWLPTAETTFHQMTNYQYF